MQTNEQTNATQSKKHLSKGDFARMGMPIYLTTINSKMLKEVKSAAGKEGTKFLAEATRPFAIKALFKCLFYLVVMLGVIIALKVSGEADADFIVYAVMIYGIASFFFLVSSKPIFGYTELQDGFLWSLTALAGYLLSFPFQIIFLVMSIALGGTGEKAKNLREPKIGIPKNIGLDELIYEGAARDNYFKFMNVVDRQVAASENKYYTDRIKEDTDEINRQYSNISYGNARENQAAHKTIDELEKDREYASSHLK